MPFWQQRNAGGGGQGGGGGRVSNLFVIIKSLLLCFTDIAHTSLNSVQFLQRFDE